MKITPNDTCNCNICKVELKLDIFNINVNTHRVRFVDGTKFRGFFCSECAVVFEARVMNKTFVEVYKKQMIFKSIRGYCPYWGCPYAFETLEECRARIDNAHIAIVNGDLLEAVNI